MRLPVSKAANACRVAWSRPPWYPPMCALALGVQGHRGRLAVEHQRIREHQLADGQAPFAFRLGGERHDLPDGRVAEHVVVLVAQHVDRIGRDAVDDVVGGARVEDLDQGLPGRRCRRGAHELPEPQGGVPVHDAHPVLVAGDPVRLLVRRDRVEAGAQRRGPQALDEPVGDVREEVGHLCFGTKRDGHDLVPLAGGDDPVQQVDQRPLDLQPVGVGHPLEQRLARKNSASPPRIWARTSSGRRACCICWRVSRGFPA